LKSRILEGLPRDGRRPDTMHNVTKPPAGAGVEDVAHCTFK
jgi:hypothetical protein